MPIIKSLDFYKMLVAIITALFLRYFISKCNLVTGSCRLFVHIINTSTRFCVLLKFKVFVQIVKIQGESG